VPSRLPSYYGQDDGQIRSGEPTYATAFVEYTRIPAAMGGGGGALGLQIAGQAPQAKWASPWMSKGFTRALAYEAIFGTALLAGVLTILDPEHRWEGGLDEPRFHQHEHINPFQGAGFRTRPLQAVPGTWPIQYQ